MSPTVLSAGARRARPAGRRQRQARDHPDGRPDRGPGDQRRPDRGRDGARSRSSSTRSASSRRRLFVFLIRREEPTPDRHVDEHGRAAPGPAPRGRGGLRYVLGNRYLRGIAASHRDREPLQHRSPWRSYIVYVVRDLGLDAGRDRDRLRPRQHRVDRRRVDREPRRRAARPRAGHRDLDVPQLPGRCCSSPSRRRRSPSRSSWPRDSCSGLSAVIYNINQVSFRQAITPAPMQGRMNATMRFIVWGTIPIGADPRRRSSRRRSACTRRSGSGRRLDPGGGPAAHHAGPDAPRDAGADRR